MEAIAQHIESYELYHDNNTSEYSQLKTHYDAKNKIGWFLMDSYPRPCFTPTLLNELSDYITNVKSEMVETNNEKYDYLVVGSNVEGVFNLGGDLDLFTSLIKQRDREGLLKYALHCIDILYDNTRNFGAELTTVSLIQGDALGGGFESALSSNLIIAERGTKMGFPEILFNLFPGMGAYTLLSKKIGVKATERLIFSGKLYSAEEMFDMGVIDILAEKGEGELALLKHIKAVNKTPNTYRAMAQIKDTCNPIDYEELVNIAHIWADAALNLTEKNIRMMTRLVNRQSTKVDSNQK